MKRNRATEKGKMLVEESQPDADMDELLAVLGYKVKSSDMADVALKLQQLEMLMCNNSSGSNNTSSEDESSHISNETVHYNPSDLSGWVQSMLVERKNINPNSNNIDFGSGSRNVFISFSNDQENQVGGNVFDDDLSAIPGKDVLRNGNLQTLEDGAEKNNIKKSKSFPIGSDLMENLQDFEDGVGKNNKKIKAFPIGSNFNANLQDLEDGVGKSNTNIKAFTIEPNFTGNLESVAARPVVLVDTQEAGIRLVHTMMACAEAIEQNDMKLAQALVKHIGVLAAPSQVGAMRKVATHFAEALARRIYKIYPHDLLQSSYNDLLENHFYETCPYLKFAHFTANQAILEAFSGSKRVHVIDFSLKQGMQWPALLQALALRPGGPPSFRLTGVGPPQPDNTDSLQEVGWKLAQLAETIGVEFEFKGFVANSLADLDASILEIRPSDIESVAVNSVFELHKLLARPSSIDKVLSSIKSMNPKIMTIVEQEGNHNGGVFLERFNEALHYYSTMFDSLEGGSELTRPNNEDLMMSEMYLGRQICNVVACEGVERVERHETLTQWRRRMSSAGFNKVHLGSNAFKQASMLLALFGGDGYRVEENDGCLMLGWHTRPLIATSAWHLRPFESD